MFRVPDKWTDAAAWLAMIESDRTTLVAEDKRKMEGHAFEKHED